jgi:hypothetical protein
LATGAVVGALVAGLAWAITGRHSIAGAFAGGERPNDRP